jgi:adenine-specific DNA-methyltransferase
MQNLLDDLTKLLQKDDRFTAEGKLLKNKVIEASLQLDPALLKLLLSNKTIKKHFFQEVGGISVFDKIKFQKFISNKSFLPDSYTSYKNKIGLTVDNEFISESKEVVLSWAYKDCVLEGGQTKEDEKRDEIFWNEVLAPDEIDRLLSPKVLTNFKKYDSKGEHKINDISLNDNLIIKGNNLLALHSLLPVYRGKVNFIYLDPPYNTDKDSFRYNDSFNHSTWLTFMSNRIRVAKELLNESGSILIQCDDKEAAYLKILMDEIFKPENYLVTIYFQVRYGKKTLAEDNDFHKVIEQAHLYSKYKPLFKPQRKKVEYNVNKFEWEITTTKPIKTIEIAGKKVEIYKPASYEIKRIEPNLKALKETWATGSLLRQKGSSGEFLAKYLAPRKEEDGLSCLYKVYGIGEDGLGYRYFTGPKKETATKGKFYSGIPLDTLAELEKGNAIKESPIENFYDFAAEFGNCRLEGQVDIGGGKKPEKLLELIFTHFSKKDDIILDSFIGSGSTCAVAQKLGRHYVVIP